ncbi:hypothetical protein M0802_002135 [Mischocyttarus mexicanus]|nr:hypothetical protein M0802_002135 [Mischocyttarus mexicanus]
MAPVSLKGTRKTYSFEERKILINLINKYEDIEDRKSDPISMTKKKSAWSLLVDEYNSIVGTQSARSVVQLRRCWENMKAYKRIREEKKNADYDQSLISSWENGTIYEKPKQEVTSTNLPPNVVFKPKDSEPYTLQSVNATKPTNMILKREPDNIVNESNDNTLKHISDNQETIINKQSVSMISSQGTIISNDNNPQTNDLSIMDHNRSTDENESIESSNHKLAYKSDKIKNFALSSPSRVNDSHVSRKSKISLQKEDELQLLALSEAQIKVEVATMLKEEARIKLEEAHYRKEEAKLRVLFFTYKLESIKGD